MLTLVHGAEPRLARRRVSQLAEEAIAKGALVQEVDCAESDMTEVVSQLGTSSLFEKEKLLVVRDPLSFSGWDDKELQQAFFTTNAVFFVSGQVKKSEVLYKFVSKHGTIEEFSSLSFPQLKSWLDKEAVALNASFALGAQDLLLASCGQDLEKLSQELRKLAAYRSFPKQAITKEDVLLLVGTQVEPKIFSTIDAMAEKNVRKATRLLAGHFAAGEHPLQLLSMFAWQFRILLSVKDLQERGVLQHDIARRLKLHPFVAQKSIQAAARFSFEELKELYRKLYSLDVSFKTSSGNQEQLLYLFFARAATKEKR